MQSKDDKLSHTMESSSEAGMSLINKLGQKFDFTKNHPKHPLYHDLSREDIDVILPTQNNSNRCLDEIIELSFMENDNDYLKLHSINEQVKNSQIVKTNRSQLHKLYSKNYQELDGVLDH